MNKSDNFKWTPLHHAAHSGILDVVEAIVEAGASINAESITKATPLMRAIESSSFPVCEYLINKGAKVMHENISGLEPLTVAAEFADPRIYHLINEKVTAAGPQKQKSGARKKSGSATSKKRPQTGGKSAKTDAVRVTNLSPLRVSDRSAFRNRYHWNKHRQRLNPVGVRCFVPLLNWRNRLKIKNPLLFIRKRDGQSYQRPRT